MAGVGWVVREEHKCRTREEADMYVSVGAVPDCKQGNFSPLLSPAAYSPVRAPFGELCDTYGQTVGCQ